MHKSILLFPIAALLTLPADSHAQTGGDILARDEYAVYSAVISQKYVKAQVKLLVIANPTCCEVVDRAREQLPSIFQPLSSLSQETVESYLKRNDKQMLLRKSFKLSVKYRLVDYDRIDRLFDMIDLEGKWKTFHRMYPGSNGYLRLSRVGFNSARDQALVQTAWMCGSLCGEGRYVLLQKEGGRWRVAKDVLVWVV